MDALAIEKWLEEKIGHETYTPGLERVTKAIDTLNLRPASKIITVAGTNGKGSVSRLLSISLHQKYSVACFTSPHIYNITERFLINESLVDEQLLYNALSNISQYDFSLTYYEYLLVAFLYLLKENWPDYIILEVGLGGRLDATNILDSEIAIVTSISRDHQEYLGHRFDEILLEKLAIARKKLVTGFDLNYLRNITEVFCRGRGIDHINISSSNSFRELNLKIVDTVLKELVLNIPVVDIPTYTYKDICNKKISFFSSHNPDAVRKLVQFLKQEHYNKAKDSCDLLVLSFSHRDMIDLVSMVKTYKLLQPKLIKKIVITSFDHPKAEKVAVLKEVCKINGIKFVKNIKKEIAQANTIMCSGSNYFYRSFMDSASSLSK